MNEEFNSQSLIDFVDFAFARQIKATAFSVLT